jgi:hypothetical protein
VDDLGQPTGYHFVLGMTVDANGDLYVFDDPAAGARGGRGHVYKIPYRTP